MSILYVQFPEDFNERYEEYRDMLLDIIKEKEPKEKENLPTNIQKKDTIADVQIELSAGKLGSYADGTIRYGKEILQMRNQLKDLCRLFMSHPSELILIDRIKEELISIDKRKTTQWSTISKYVSELHTSLKIHFKKDVIFNQKEEGWYFKP